MINKKEDSDARGLPRRACGFEGTPGRVAFRRAMPTLRELLPLLVTETIASVPMIRHGRGATDQ